MLKFSYKVLAMNIVIILCHASVLIIQPKIHKKIDDNVKFPFKLLVLSPDKMDFKPNDDNELLESNRMADCNKNNHRNIYDMFNKNMMVTEEENTLQANWEEMNELINNSITYINYRQIRHNTTEYINQRDSRTLGYPQFTKSIIRTDIHWNSNTTSSLPPIESLAKLQFPTNFRAIYPGTVWCGNGNNAKTDTDMGVFYRADECCKKHDNCKISIEPGDTWMGLQNQGLFTRSHCDCDKEFLDCLKMANSLITNSIGYTYFNLLAPPCFREEYPIVSCMLRIKGRCLTYVVDETKPKKWQWMDNKFY